MLGVPTVADRVAQTVVRMDLEPKVEPIFHPDSYGTGPANPKVFRHRAARHAAAQAGPPME
jgi:hypothetical protein